MKKSLFSKHLLASMFLLLLFANVNTWAQTSNFFYGFETPPGPNDWSSDIRVPSGTNGVVSATGNWHGQTLVGRRVFSFTRFGGYNSVFPACGYKTSLDIYLNTAGAWDNDTRFDYTSAINDPAGVGRRDFVFNVGYYNDADVTGAGPRFVISASNNTDRSNSFPKNPGRTPQVIVAPGWYTFEHSFRNNGAGILAVDLTIYNASNIPVATWTLSDPTDVIGTTVGGNRYGWVPNNEFNPLAIDNATLTVNGVDGIGDPCDPDEDNDGVPDVDDCAPLDPNVSTQPMFGLIFNGTPVANINNGSADPTEAASVTVCDGGQYTVAGHFHSSPNNLYDITITSTSGGVLLFNGSPAGNGTITAAQFSGSAGTYTITLADPDMGGTVEQTITPFIDLNGNGTREASDCDGDPIVFTYTATPRSTEVCNGIDDDCDGLVDEGFTNTDGDGMANCVDPDDDGDGVPDTNDNCPLAPNPGQANNDGDAQGDACDTDDDNDGVLDADDNCPLVANGNQANNDGDALGDVCDPDDDNDGVLDGADNCPKTANANQKDSDHDGQGDVCDVSCTINNNDDDDDDDGDGDDDDSNNGNAGNNGVRICHEGKEICVKANEVQSHLNHGDKLGPCTYAPCKGGNDFSKPVVLSPTQAPGKWYTDRYAPAGFVSPVNFGGNARLKHSIAVSGGTTNRPAAYSAPFYNTQGRKYDLTNGTTYMEIELFVPLAWKTTGRRMAGFWGTAFDAFNNVSGFPIIEFTSEGGPARFRGYNNNNLVWIDMGLPAGFTYNKWVTLSIELLPSGEFRYRVENLQATTTAYTVYNSKRIGNLILQGHNTTTGVNYDIYWDDFAFRCYKGSGGDDDDDDDDRPITSVNGANTDLSKNLSILPKDFKLSSYPNPFAGRSTIKYELPFDSKVSIKVYDVLGRVVAHLVDTERKAGIHTVAFNAGGVSKGFLYYKIVAQSKDKRFEQTNKMIHIQ